MPFDYDLKSDIRYQQGVKEGLRQYQEQKVKEYFTIVVINMLLKTDFTNKKIASLAPIELPFVTKWAKALTEYEVEKTWDSFKVIEDDKKGILKRATAIAKNLVKINGLSDEIIGEICELKKAKITQIRKVEKKKLINEKGKKTIKLVNI